jgi:negative regulator of replication initiation
MRRLLLILALTASPANASELVFQFKNPSFSGQNASAQWITTESEEHSRVQAIQDKIDAALKAKALAEQNSILNRFMNNLQSRIYSQLAQQLTQNLFAGGKNAGTFDLDGNTIAYEKTLDTIKLTITDADNNVTQIEIPLSGFSF